MARTHTVVGLTDEARDFVKNLRKLDARVNYITDAFTLGQIPLGVWVDPGEDPEFVYVERLQAEPWDGGPWSFTHLLQVRLTDFYSNFWVYQLKSEFFPGLWYIREGAQFTSRFDWTPEQMRVWV